MADETEQLLAAGFEIRGGTEGDHLWGWPGSPDLLRQYQALALLAAEQDEKEDR